MGQSILLGFVLDHRVSLCSYSGVFFPECSVYLDDGIVYSLEYISEKEGKAIAGFIACLLFRHLPVGPHGCSTVCIQPDRLCPVFRGDAVSATKRALCHDNRLRCGRMFTYRGKRNVPEKICEVIR